MEDSPYTLIPSSMDTFSILKEEHVVMNGIFAKINGTAEAPKKGRQELFDRLNPESGCS